jgi:hypothetical protein
MYTPPKIQTVTFFDTVVASTSKTLLSKKITAPFKISKVRAAFPAGVNRLLLLRFFIVSSTDLPTTAPPIGTDVLFSLGQVNYVTGNDNFVEFEHELLSLEANKYIAVYAENQDAFPHTIECQVTIATHEGWDPMKGGGGDHSTGTVSYRNHNPGNLRSSVFENGKRDGFAVFINDSVGFGALVYDIWSKAQGKTSTGLSGVSTIEDFIHVWAPANENDTEAYINFIVSHTGLSRNTPFSSLLREY